MPSLSLLGVNPQVRIHVANAYFWHEIKQTVQWQQLQLDSSM